MYLSVSGFLKFSKIVNFDPRFGEHSFSVNSFISKVFFPNNVSSIFVFTIATILLATHVSNIDSCTSTIPR